MESTECSFRKLSERNIRMTQISDTWFEIVREACSQRQGTVTVFSRIEATLDYVETIRTDKKKKKTIEAALERSLNERNLFLTDTRKQNRQIIRQAIKTTQTLLIFFCQLAYCSVDLRRLSMIIFIIINNIEFKQCHFYCYLVNNAFSVWFCLVLCALTKVGLTVG